MTDTRLYECSAKGELIPEASPNSTCKTWRLITALIRANTAAEAEALFKQQYGDDCTEFLDAKIVPEDSPLYKAATGMEADSDE